MVISILAIFILGYLAITFEHALKIDKLIPALLMMACTWGLLLMNSEAITFWLDPNNPQLINVIPNLLGAKSMLIESTLLHHFGKTAEILIFLIGAMAIVEIIDYFDGFSVFQKRLFMAYSASAKDRYLELINRHPGIEQLIPQHQIASYLGVLPESLSRIKRQLIQHKK